MRSKYPPVCAENTLPDLSWALLQQHVDWSWLHDVPSARLHTICHPQMSAIMNMSSGNKEWAKINKYPNNHGFRTVAGERGLMTAVVSVEAGWGTTEGCHVISRLVPIGKVSTIITHISGKVGILKLKPALLICSSTSRQSVAKSSKQKFVFQTQLE